jgi:hypothetical protein
MFLKSQHYIALNAYKVYNTYWKAKLLRSRTGSAIRDVTSEGSCTSTKKTEKQCSDTVLDFSNIHFR